LKDFLDSFKKKVTNNKLKILIAHAIQATFASVIIVKLDPATNPPSNGPTVNPKPKATPNKPIPLVRFLLVVISAI